MKRYNKIFTKMLGEYSSVRFCIYIYIYIKLLCSICLCFYLRFRVHVGVFTSVEGGDFSEQSQ